MSTKRDALGAAGFFGTEAQPKACSVKGLFMRLALSALALSVGLSAAAAQSETPPSLEESTGRTNLKSHQENNQQTPQGPSGPLNTTTGGAPASSPQGETPPGMQSAPEGSRQTIVDPKGPVVDPTNK